MQNKKQCKIRNTPSRSSDGGLSNDIKYFIKTACKIQAALGRSIYVFLILHDLFFGDKWGWPQISPKRKLLIAQTIFPRRHIGCVYQYRGLVSLPRHSRAGTISFRGCVSYFAFTYRQAFFDIFDRFTPFGSKSKSTLSKSRHSSPMS